VPSSHPIVRDPATGRRSSRKNTHRHRVLKVEPLEDRSLLAAFTPGNLVVYRVGDVPPNSLSLATNGSPVFLDEYTPGGTLVQTVALPKVQDGLNRPLVANGQRAEEGALTLSADGRYLFLTGYDRPLPPVSGALQSTAASAVNRTIGRVDWLGIVDTTMGLSNLEKGINSIASYDGSQVWVTGENGSVQRAVFASSTSTFVVGVTPSTIGRQLHIFEDQLYISTSSRIAKVGTGLPTSSASLTGPAEWNLSNSFGFFFADLSAAVAGLDTLYVASDGSAALSKYSLYDGVWTLTGTVGTASDDYRGLTASVSGTTVTLYAVAGGGTTASGGGRLVKLIDSSGYAGTLAGTPTTLSTAANQTAFRGVAWVPHSDNSAPIYTTTGNPTLGSIAQNAINNSGILIADLIASGGGDPIADPDSGALEGLALVTADYSAGQWEYSLNNGANWSPLGSISLTSARLLAADNATRIRLVPDGSFTGILHNALQFRAWDQTAGSNGDLVNPVGSVGADGAFSLATETASIEVVAYTNTPPSISTVSDQTVNEDGSVLVAFSVNDDGGAASLVVTASSNNSAILPAANIVLSGAGTDRTVLLSPLANLSGDVTVTITVSDGELSRSEEFLLSVTPVNDAPTIPPITDRSTAEDTALPPITLELSDPDELSQLTVAVESDNPTLFPASSLVLSGSGTNRTLTATPEANQHGTANVTVTATDSSGASATETFVITVTAVNDLPILSTLDDITTDEDQSPADVLFTIADQETAAGTMQLAFASSDPLLFPPTSIVMEGTGQNRTIRITPAENHSGVAIISVTLTDGDGGQDIETFTIQVIPVNDAPTLDSISDQATDEDVSIAGIPLLAADLETDTEDLEIVAASSNEALFPAAGLVVSRVGSDWTLGVVPAADKSGSATITVSVKDAEGLTAIRSFTATVTAQNDAATISALEDVNAAEDALLPDINLTLADQETSAEALTVSVASSNPQLFPAESLIVIGNGATRLLRLTPAANGFGSAVIQVTVTDGDNLSTNAIFTVNLAAANDAPTITEVGDIPLAANQVAGPITVTMEDVDHASESLVFTVQSSNLDLIPLERIEVTGSAGTRTLTITPIKNQSGTASITLSVKDAAGLQSSTTFAITVAENQAPTITTIADRTLLEDGSLNDISFAIGDHETNLGELVVSVSSDNLALLPASALTITGEGSERTLRILPVADQFGVATVTITVTDENGATTSRSFEVEVHAVNDAPVAVHALLSVSQEAPESATFAGSDIDSTTLSYELASLPLRGIVAITNPATGAYTYRPYPGEHGPDRFTFRVRDGQAVSNLATVVVSIEPFQPRVTLDAGVLSITGTPYDDYIAVAPFDETSVIAIVGSQRLGPFPNPERIRLFGGDGRDVLLVHNLSIPTELDYGAEPMAQATAASLSSAHLPSAVPEPGSEVNIWVYPVTAPSNHQDVMEREPLPSDGYPGSQANLAGRLIDLALLQILRNFGDSSLNHARSAVEAAAPASDVGQEEALFDWEFLVAQRTLWP